MMRQMGLNPVQGGASGALLANKPAVGWQNALQPGDPIAGILVSGDMSMTGLGTVSFNDGKRVLGFGHPFFNLGPVEMPMAKGEVLQIVVFVFLFGAACAAIGPKAKPVIEFAESLAEVMFKYTAYVMYLAPVGVFAAIAVTVGSKGFDVLYSLGKLVLTLYGALFVFVVFVLGPVMWLCKIPLKRFFDHVKEPWLIAFSTATSEAALVASLRALVGGDVVLHRDDVVTQGPQLVIHAAPIVLQILEGRG